MKSWLLFEILALHCITTSICDDCLLMSKANKLMRVIHINQYGLARGVAQPPHDWAIIHTSFPSKHFSQTGGQKETLLEHPFLQKDPLLTATTN